MRVKAFTLIEIIIAMAVMAIIAAIAIPLYQGNLKEAEVEALIAEIDSLKKDVVTYAVAKNIDLCHSPKNLPVPDLSRVVGVNLTVVPQDLQYAKPLALLVQSGEVDIASKLYQHYKGTAVIGPNPIVTGSVVSFTIQLVQQPCKHNASVSNQCPSGQTAYTLFRGGFSGPTSTYCLDTCPGEVDMVGRCCPKKDLSSRGFCNSGSYVQSVRHSELK